MPLTAAMIQADLANIAVDIPGAVVTCVIGGSSVSAIRASGIAQAGDQAAFGLALTSDERLIISRAAYPGTLPEPSVDTVTVDGTERLVTQVIPDAIGATFQLILAQTDPNP